ncbi:OsmC/Ohr family [Podospora fimiseda]|uniref:OsmC/Ohr family n=1 Tax=Podospora fimiseda TaxID=252190 RepID=A0AAN7GSE7_9PEZI|nr:OsmC/Ohr family [Podospora fimiseda]
MFRPLLTRRSLPRATNHLHLFSTTPHTLQSIPLQITGTGTGTQQHITIADKSYTISTDTYTGLGGQDSQPSPVSYSLASLSSCNQVTGAVVAKDHGIKLGKWHVTVDALLPTAVLVGGQQGNPNWESVKLKARVQTDVPVEDKEGKFQFFVQEVERRCPITTLFKLSGVRYESEWVNERIE